MPLVCFSHAPTLPPRLIPLKPCPARRMPAVSLSSGLTACPSSSELSTYLGRDVDASDFSNNSEVSNLFYKMITFT